MGNAKKWGCGCAVVLVLLIVGIWVLSVVGVLPGTARYVSTGHLIIHNADPGQFEAVIRDFSARHGYEIVPTPGDIQAKGIYLIVRENGRHVLSAAGETGRELHLMLQPEGKTSQQWNPLWNEIHQDLRTRLGPAVKIESEIVYLKQRPEVN